MKIEKGFSQKIDENYTLRIAGDSLNNLERIISFNIAVHKEESLSRYITRLFTEHPRKDEILCLYIEENDSKKIISSITLCPLIWNFGGILIPICEMGLVGTLPNFRNRGLMKILNKFYETIMEQKGYILSIIRGIPYYYRRFGYEFVLNLDERIFLNTEHVPKDKMEHISIIKAKKEDLDFIKSGYNKENEKFFIFNEFDDESFYYKFMNDSFDENFLSTYLIKVNGKSISYFCIGMSYDNSAYTLLVPNTDEKNMIKILQFAKNFKNQQFNKEIQFHVNSQTNFADFLCSLGGKNNLGYSWQIRIPNFKNFLLSFIPGLERRIENSIYKELTQEVLISNYKEIFTLEFVNGKIDKIQAKRKYPLEENCDVIITGTNIIKMFLSDRNFGEIKYIIRDSSLKKGSEKLIEILFPKLPSNPDTYY